MKTLIYSMQNSGASLYAYWLAQEPNTVAVLDLYFDQIAPAIDYENVILKCVVNKDIPLENHLDSFQPDRLILFVRNTVENYLRLYEKRYGDWGGTVDEKMAVLNHYIGFMNFDEVVKYEDFLAKKLGHFEYYKFPRSLCEVVDFNKQNSEWCNVNYRKNWGTGNIHANRLDILNCYDNFPNLSKLYT